MRLLPLAPLGAALFLAATAQADDIYLTDGKTISGVTIQTEGLEKIVYRKDRRNEEVSSERVLDVAYSSKPQLVDLADDAIGDDQLLDAEADLLNFVEGLDAPPRKHPWSRAYAIYRLQGVYQALGKVDDAVAAGEHLAQVEPDSRYLPYAMARNAQVLSDAGRGPAALKAIEGIYQLVDTGRLGERWRLEVELGRALYGGQLTGTRLRAKLEELAQRAGTQYPVVRNRAEVAVGEALAREDDLAAAEEVFRRITSDPKADARTLAAAYTGLGLCLWEKGKNGDTKVLTEALVSFMRVVVNYRNEAIYVPRALFYAGRCFQTIGGPGADEKATKLYNKVRRDYPESRWARDAKSFLPKKKR